MRMKKQLYILPITLMMVCSCEKERQPEPNPTPTMSTVEIVDGAIEAPFSVSNGKVVYFSQGNLQYNAATRTWRFADEQYEIRKEENKKKSPTYNGWIDLFGWGTSGYNGCMPYQYSNDHTDYPGGSDIAGTNYDWGLFNAISNGGNEPGVWRILTRNEWDYLLGRYDEDVRPMDYIVEVHGVKGLLLLPDNFVRDIGFYSWYSGQKISDADWNKLQRYGAVFIPESGYLFYASYGDSLVYSKYMSGIWTSSGCNWNSVYSWHVIFHSTYASVADNYFGVTNGLPVRLVKDEQ